MNSLRIALALLMALTGPLAAAGAPSEPYSLGYALLIATRNNAELQLAEQNIIIAKQRVKEARYLFYPDVGLQATATRFNARYPFALRPDFGSTLLSETEKDNLFSGKAYMTLSLYEGRRHINTLRLARTALKRARSKYEAAKLDILHETKRAFYKLVLAQEVAGATRGVLEDIGRHTAGVRGDPLDMIEAESLAGELRAADAEAAHHLELARLDLLKCLNRELDAPIRVEGKLETRPLEVDLRNALVWATELRPELQSQTYRAQMDAIAVNLTLGRRNPQVLLGLDYEVTGQEFPLRRNNWDATVGVRLPFSFNFWPQHRQKVAEQRQGEIRRAEMQDRVRLEVRKSHQETLYWEAEWPRREQEYLELEKMLAGAMSGRAPSVRSLRASVRVLESKKRFMESVTEHILARARLERAVGRAFSNPL